jgi:hypothetical protein
MALTYELLDYSPFRSQFYALNKQVQIMMSKEILKLKTDPYCKECKPLGWDLEGIRRIHVGPIIGVLYCVAYITCEECKNKRLETKFACLDCFKRKWYHIKLISCGPRDEFYTNLRKNWQSWMRTVEWEKSIQGRE